MKKIFIGLSAMALTLLVGCNPSNATFATSLDSKMTNLQNTINSIATLETTTFAGDETENVQATSGFMPFNPYGNVNTYGFPFMYGAYPFGMGYGNYGYGGNFGGYANPYGNYISGFNYRNNPVANRWISNIDTYRINQITKDGETKTTVDSYRNGKHLGQTTLDDEQSKNLQSICENCFASNTRADQLKTQILQNINMVKDLSNKIKTADIELSHKQVKDVNQHLQNINHAQSKINLARGELNQDFNSVKKATETQQTDGLDGKYMRLLGTMEARNTYLQNILASLLQVENCIDGNCGYAWNGTNTNPNWLNNCPNGECNNCQDCNQCTTCNNCGTCTNCNTCTDCANCTSSSGCQNCTNCNSCLLCEDCQDCENCFNCKDCINCTNIANAIGWRDNKPCENCAPYEDNANQNPPQTLPQQSSDASIVVDESNTPQTLEINADDVVEENLLDENKILPEPPQLTKDIKEPTEFLTENIEDESQANSIFNENPHENNKSLTS